MEQMKCPYCGKMVDKTRKDQRTCGDPDCQYMHGKFSSAQYYNSRTEYCRHKQRELYYRKRRKTTQDADEASDHTCLGITL